MSNSSTYNGKIKNPKKPKKEINKVFLKTFEEKSKNLGITSIGYAKIPGDIFHSNNMLKYSNAIVLTVPINIPKDDTSVAVSGVENSIDTLENNNPVDVSGDDFSIEEYLENNPPSEKAIELYDEYISFGDLTYELSDILRKEGFSTQVLHPAEDLINLSKLGQYAGLGYIGKNGLLISPELGPRLKLSAILTTIENLPNNEKNSHKWIKNYCESCDDCIKGCLEKALIETDDNLSEANFIEEKCHIGSHKGCTSCIEICPFFEKGYVWVKENK